MSAGGAPHPAAPPGAAREGGAGGVCGAAEIGFARAHGTTRLAHLYQRNPLRVLFPEPADDCALAVLVTTSGGLVAGDRLDIDVAAGAGAAAHVTASAAEKIYRSTGATTAVRQSLAVAEGGWLEFLPAETILFEGARLRRETRVELAPGAGFLGGDLVVFGRRARGERFTRGFLREVWEVRRGGELVWGDALHLDGEVAATIAHPACFGGAAAFATLILAPPAGDPRRFLDAARAVQAAASGVTAGATVVGGLLVARWLAADAAPLREAYTALARHLRAVAAGRPPLLPRLWQV